MSRSVTDRPVPAARGPGRRPGPAASGCAVSEGMASTRRHRDTDGWTATPHPKPGPSRRMDAAGNRAYPPANRERKPIHARIPRRPAGKRRRHRRHHRQLPAGQRAWPGRVRGHRRVAERRHRGPGDQGHGADGGRPQLHRRRRHPRLRHRPQASPDRGAHIRRARRQPQAGGPRSMATHLAAGWRTPWRAITASPCHRRRSGCRRC